MILNLKNSKVYIGSSVNMHTRKLQHFRQLKKNIHHNKYLQRSYNKYGKENFYFIVLEEDVQVEELFKKENDWIVRKKSMDITKGYNLAIPLKDERLLLSDETIQKKIINAYNQHHINNPNISLEDFLNGKRAKDLRIKLPHKTKKKILGFNKDTGELIKKFNSISELCTSSKISKIINNQQYSYKGMVLIEEKMYDCNIVYKQIKKEIIKKPNYIKIGRFKGSAVETFNLETNEIIKKYTTSLELANDFNITKRYVYRVLCGERKSFKNMGIRYSE